MGPARASPGGAAAPPSGGQAPSPPPPPGTGLAASAAPAVCRPRPGGAAAPVEHLGRCSLGGAPVAPPTPARRGPRCCAATAGPGLRPSPSPPFVRLLIPRASLRSCGAFPPSGQAPTFAFFPLNFFFFLLTSIFLSKKPHKRGRHQQGVLPCQVHSECGAPAWPQFGFSVPPPPAALPAQGFWGTRAEAAASNGGMEGLADQPGSQLCVLVCKWERRRAEKASLGGFRLLSVLFVPFFQCFIASQSFHLTLKNVGGKATGRWAPQRHGTQSCWHGICKKLKTYLP